MAGLDIDLRYVDDSDVAVAELAGAIDGTTVVNFQESLEEITRRGVTKLILDMANIKYVNSTGLGSLVKYADKLKTGPKGGMALIRVPPKVKIVIEMLGLHAFFEIKKTEEEAIEALKSAGGEEAAEAAPAGGGEGGGQPAAPASQGTSQAGQATEQPSPPASQPSSQPSPATTGPPSAPTEDRTAARPSGEQPPATRTGGLPAQVACGGCGVTLEIDQAGNFKCPRCYTLVSVTAEGGVRFMARDRAEPLSLDLSFHETAAEGLNAFVGAVARSVLNGGHQGVQRAVYAVYEALRDQNEAGAAFHVMIDTDGGGVTVKLADQGQAVDASRVDQVFGGAKGQVDEFEHRPHPRGGNVVRLHKK